MLLWTSWIAFLALEPSVEEGAAASTDVAPDSQDRPPSPPPEAKSDLEGASSTDAEPAEELSQSGENLTLGDVFGPAEHTPEPNEPSDDETKPLSDGMKSHWTDKLNLDTRILSSAYFAVDRGDRIFERNENRLEFRLAYRPHAKIELVGDIEAVAFGVAPARTLDDLASRQNIQRFHLESDAAYVAVYDLLPNLDIRLGRQVLVWGTADKFNPTNNFNPDDLEDRPLFTEPIANQMMVVDWAPLQDRLYFQLVYVPFFYPALLPPSAAAALQDPLTPAPFANQSDVDKIEAAQALFDIDPGLIPTITSNVVLPRPRFTNGQAGFKVGSNFGGIFDLSVSYYIGRHDIPAPTYVESVFKEEATGELMTAGCCVESVAQLVYPRMQVIGLDFATQLPFAGNMGLWGEAGLFIPERVDLYTGFPRPQDVTPDDGIDNPETFVEGPGIESTPHIKATAGVDYTAGRHVYLQAQYLRGFIDELGAAHIGNYLMAGTELTFLGRHLLIRLFGVVDFPSKRQDWKSSYVVAPSIQLKPPWGFVTFEAGSFVLIGAKETKFGQSATGSSLVFGKVVGEF